LCPLKAFQEEWLVSVFKVIQAEKYSYKVFSLFDALEGLMAALYEFTNSLEEDDTSGIPDPKQTTQRIATQTLIRGNKMQSLRDCILFPLRR
jgi:hypothetical protein